MENTEQPNTTNIGRNAEEQVLGFLENYFHYRLLIQNFKWKRGEADLIFEDEGGAIVLVEVRSAKKENSYLKQSVSGAKWRHLRNTLEVFMKRYPRFRNRPRRIEVTWVVAGHIEHWKNPL